MSELYVIKNRPEATLINNLDGVVDEFFERGTGFIGEHQEPGSGACAGVRLFCEQEVDFKQAYDDETTLPNQEGIPGKVLVGVWKYHPSKDLYIRTDLFGSRPTLCQGGMNNSWIYEVLADYKDHPDVQSRLTTSKSGLQISETQRALALGAKFEKAIYAYINLVDARTPINA